MGAKRAAVRAGVLTSAALALVLGVAAAQDSTRSTMDEIARYR